MPARLANKFRGLAFALTIVLLLAGCSEPSAPPEHSEEKRGSAPSFVNQVWRVRESSAVAPGTLYVFLGEGTLVITSPDSKPALGKWKYESGALTMIEEGIAYKVDILKSSANEFKIKSNNPGEPVEITLVPAN